MKIEYSINECTPIELPNNLNAYSSPDNQEEVARSCVNHYFNWLENKLDHQEVYGLVVYFDGVVKFDCRVCAMVDLVYIE